LNTGFRHAIAVTAAFVLLLWLIELLDLSFGLNLSRLGVYPRELQGLPGILAAPLIHGGWLHLASNSFALLVLGTVMLYGYPRAALPLLVLVWLGTGIGVWLFARGSYHFGASGLTHGLMFFIFVSGILRHDRLSIALSMIVFFLYGGMVWTVFPTEPGVSFESHFFGAVMGLTGAFLFFGRDPLPPEKHYDWEAEDEPDDGESRLADPDRVAGTGPDQSSRSS
jgi:membrane associated rhomboid family serine protease